MTKITRRSFSESAAQHLLAAGYTASLAKIYAARDISASGQLDYSLTNLYPIEQLKNASTMAILLADAIASNKKILVVADYDADGATACAVAVRGLRSFGAQVDFIVPNRFTYGYGLTPEIVQLAAQSQPDILITVDNGIASVDGVAEANRLNMQVLITDHHLPGDVLPDAACIVNPNQPGCPFPSKNLAGVGVMFYVLLALRAELRTRGAFATQVEPKLAELLDLVALGTVADVVKLDQNNRILVQQGLLRIRAGKTCAGIAALFQIAKKNPARVISQDLGFAIGPRLNAAGRLEDMRLGIECLLSDDEAAAMLMAARLDALNHERRGIETDMQALAMTALESVQVQDNYSLALFDDNWHQGVIGILASRLKDKFHRPVIAFALSDNNELKGSGRSIGALHLRDALDLISKRHPTLIKKFGGHAAAAGLTIVRAEFDHFVTAFEQVVRELLSDADLQQKLESDGALGAQDINLEFAQQLDQQIWGQGFPVPLFDDGFVVQQQRVVGEKHLKLRLDKAGQLYEAILFGYAEPLPDSIHAAYSLSVNEYNGKRSVQLIIRHWQQG
jgi:single-stranded-DNA-specific exonuclease